MERRKWLTWVIGQEVADKIYDNTERSGFSDRQSNFITSSFIWNGTKEGYEYWSNVHSEIEKYFARKISPHLTAFLRENYLWNKFIDNFNPEVEHDSYNISNSFLWSNTEEGRDFWEKVNKDYFDYITSGDLSSTKKSKDDENQLQGEEDPRGKGDRSERSGVCCEGDESRFRLSYTQHRKRIDFQKGEVGDFKIHISPRHPVLL